MNLIPLFALFVLPSSSQGCARSASTNPELLNDRKRCEGDPFRTRDTVTFRKLAGLNDKVQRM